MEAGVDVVEINRIEKIKNHNLFLTKNFTESEIDYIAKKGGNAQTIAGLFACKEAILKALGLGIGRGLKLNEISIVHKPNGSPYVEITPQLNYYLNLLNCNSISVSISHDAGIAVAFCIIC